MKRGIIERETLEDAEFGVGVAVADSEEEALEADKDAIEEAEGTAEEEAVVGRAEEGALVGQWVSIQLV